MGQVSDFMSHEADFCGNKQPLVTSYAKLDLTGKILKTCWFPKKGHQWDLDLLQTSKKKHLIDLLFNQERWHQPYTAGQHHFAHLFLVEVRTRRFSRRLDTSGHMQIDGISTIFVHSLHTQPIESSLKQRDLSQISSKLRVILSWVVAWLQLINSPPPSRLPASLRDGLLRQHSYSSH